MLAVKNNSKYDLETIYYFTDEVVNKIGVKNIGRPSKLNIPEVLTIGIYRYIVGGINWKSYYQTIERDYRRYFPDLPHYNNFICLLKKYTILMFQLLIMLIKDTNVKEGVFIIDSTPLKVCDNVRIREHKTFVRYARRGKNGKGYWYGFKLCLIIDIYGNIVSFKVDKASKHDLKLGKELVKNLKGMLIADRGFIDNKWAKELFEQELLLITPPRKNMKKITTQSQLDVLKIRQKIEGILSVLKRFYNLESTLYRSVKGYINHIILVMLSYQIKKIFLANS
ncbi:MAG: IS982 family transposase [Candidatus Dojkabacteria bacterium]|nr:IS982 family transposase [Candidatus Dojkabacteria bacterium]